MGTGDDRFLIITSMKNEASYILEWIAYHRVIGFTDFLVYTNDCEDCTVEMLERLEALGVLTHQANEVLRRGPQKSALKYAKDQPLAAEADWILVSDIDEFLVVKVGDGSVRALIDHVPEEADVVPVTWRLFSHGDRVDFVDEPIIAQFTDAEKPLEAGGFPDRFVKSLFRRQEEVERFGTHGPIAGDDFAWVQPDGRVLGEGDNLTRPASAFAYDVAQFNHYAVCSVDNFLVKRDRGRVNHFRQTMGLDYWRRMCRGGEEDRSILPHLDATKAEMARLMEDADIARLHREGVEWRRQRIEELRKLPKFEEMRENILKLSAARDHHRNADATSMVDAMEAEAGPDQADVTDRLKTLCKEMRELINHVSPHEAAQAAHGKLDEMENGLFGAAQR
ncbi:MAG: glycosyltransferase family 2 protein [Pseudomonadota bacterium]